MSEGMKFDNGKLRWSLLPKGTVPEVVKVLEYGAQKYAPDNWKYVPDARVRYYDAAQRHLESWWNGQEVDEESKQMHLAHAVCCLLFLLWIDKNKPGDK